MERKLDAGRVLITPGSTGWNVFHSGAPAQNVASLEAAAELAPPNEIIHFALPAGTVVIERITLPATDRSELAGMVELQLEKSLPYAPEEVASDFEILRKGETDSTVLALSISNDQLEALCQPLHSGGRVPEKITLFALHIAAASPAGHLSLVLYCEQEKIVVVISDHGKLAFVETAAAEKPAEVIAELPQILLGAELDGVPVAFTAVCVDNDCASLRPELSRMFGVPAEIFPLDKPLPEPDSNLLPATWQSERAEITRRERLKTRLVVAAIGYLFAVVAAFAWLMWMRAEARKLGARVRAEQPQIESIRGSLARWNALAPAIDPSRYPVEILNQLEKCRPNEKLRFTLFDLTKQQFQLEIEAPSANVAIEFGEKLKANPGLKAFTFEISPPAILPNEYAQMRIFGKL